MIAPLLLSAVLAATSIDHVVANLRPSSSYAVQLNGELLGRWESSAEGILEFSSPADSGLFAMNLTVPSCPDLVVQAIETLPTVPACGDSIKVRALVKNQGAAAAPAFSVGLKLDGILKTTWPIAALASGGTAYSGWYSLGRLAGGSHAVDVCADPGNGVVEENEGNNCR